MRNLIILAMLIAGASAAGWFQIQRDGEYTRIDINRAEIREDARRAIDKGREILDRRDAQNSGYPADEATPGQTNPPNYDPGSYPNQADSYQSQYSDYGTGTRYNQAAAQPDFPPYDSRQQNTGGYPSTGPYPNNGPYSNTGPYPNAGPASPYGTSPNTSPYQGQPADYPTYNQTPYSPRR